jgi:hypothetical protein
MDNAYELVKNEWAIACRRGRNGVSALEWSEREPALEGIGCINDALVRCHDQSHPTEAQAALSALMVLSGHDPVARLAVIRALLPGLSGLAARWRHPGGAWIGRGDRRPNRSGVLVWDRRGPWQSVREFDEEVVTVAFLVVRRLGGQRLEWPAAAVLSRVQRQLRTIEAASRRHSHQECLSADGCEDIFAAASAPRTGLELMLEAVHEARRRGAVSAREARIIASDRVFGWATAEIAAAEGSTVAAVQRARSRALRKMRVAMVDDVHSAGAACSA